MHTITSLLVLLLSASAFASGEPDARLSIIRKLGAGDERGIETTELVCQDKKPTCSVKKVRRNAIVESGTLSHKQGIEVISRLQKDMQSLVLSISTEVDRKIIE
jgi:hypothetical protein